VLERSDEAPSLVAAFSSTGDLSKGRVDAAAANGVYWRARLALTAILLHFPKLELELELLGFGYNADLTKDQMEVFWTQTRRLQNLCHQGSLLRLLIALLMVPGRSSSDSFVITLFFLLYPFPVSYETQINEYRTKPMRRFDHTLSFFSLMICRREI
jgi:hypothetical protein